MDEMFDHNHDGKLSASERMERDYFINEMMDHSEHTPQVHRTTGSGKVGGKILGFLFILIGANSFVYFPIFGLIMFVVAIYFFMQ